MSTSEGIAISSVFSLAMSLLTSCNVEDLASPPKAELPTNRTLRDASGRKVEARVIGREIHRITFLRISDKRRFEYPITELSEQDQAWAKSLPITFPPPETITVSNPSETTKKSFLEQEIEELEKELAETRASLYEIPSNTIKWRSQYSHFKRLQNRLRRLRTNTR